MNFSLNRSGLSLFLTPRYMLMFGCTVLARPVCGYWIAIRNADIGRCEDGTPYPLRRLIGVLKHSLLERRAPRFFMLFRLVARAFIVAFALTVAVFPTVAQEAADTSPHSDAELVTDRVAVQPGESFDVALRIDMEEGWHSYWLNAGDSGLETRI